MQGHTPLPSPRQHLIQFARPVHSQLLNRHETPIQIAHSTKQIVLQDHTSLHRERRRPIEIALHVKDVSYAVKACLPHVGHPLPLGLVQQLTLLIPMLPDVLLPSRVQVDFLNLSPQQ